MGKRADRLAELRQEIDRLDENLVALLAEREKVVRRVGAVKTDAAAVRAPARAEQVVARARAAAERHGASPVVVERVYRAMISAFIDQELTQTGLADAVSIEPLRPADAGEVLTLQRAAYVTEAQLYGDAAIPPLTQTLEQLRGELDAAHVACKAVVGQRLVGAVRAAARDGVLHVGRLVVAPDHQGRGVGTRLLAAVEDGRPPGVDAAALSTGHRSEGNLRLYRRCGYVEEGREPVHDRLTLVHLVKRLAASERPPTPSR